MISRRARVIFWTAFGVLAIAALFQVFYRIAEDGPILELDRYEVATDVSPCGHVYSNQQHDTITSCADGDHVLITMALSAFRAAPSTWKVVEAKYEKGHYRTYKNEGIGNHIGITTSLASTVEGHSFMIGVDSLIRVDDGSGVWTFVTDYVTISDDGSRLMNELRLDGVSVCTLSVDHGGDRLAFKISSVPPDR